MLLIVSFWETTVSWVFIFLVMLQSLLQAFLSTPSFSQVSSSIIFPPESLPILLQLIYSLMAPAIACSLTPKSLFAAQIPLLSGREPHNWLPTRSLPPWDIKSSSSHRLQLSNLSSFVPLFISHIQSVTKSAQFCFTNSQRALFSSSLLPVFSLALAWITAEPS